MRTTTLQIRMRQLDNAGQLVQPEVLLAEKGFPIDQTVERKRDKLKGRVVKVENECVTVERLDDANITCIVPVAEFLKGDWVKHSTKTAPEELPDWARYGPLSSKDLHYMLVKAKVLTELKGLTTMKAQKQWADQLSVFTKPRKVVAKSDIEKGALTLVPITTSIALRDPSEEQRKEKKGKDIPQSAVLIGDMTVHNSPHAAVTVWLNTCFTAPKEKDSDKKKDKGDDKQKEKGDNDKQKEKGKENDDQAHGFVNPFWLLQATNKAQEANICFELHTVGTGDHQFSIPLAVSKCAISKGTELKYLESSWPGPPQAPKRGVADAPSSRPSKSAKR